jgi:hypothetical protein
MAEPIAVHDFYSALNRLDPKRPEASLQPDFEMVFPQKPARGFRGRDQQISNMRPLFDTYPDFRVEVEAPANHGFVRGLTRPSAGSDGGPR